LSFEENNGLYLLEFPELELLLLEEDDDEDEELESIDWSKTRLGYALVICCCFFFISSYR